MADKKKVNNKKPPVKTNRPTKAPKGPVVANDAQKQKAIQQLLGKYGGGASYLAEQFYGPGSMGRISSGYNEDAQGNVVKDASGNPQRIGETQGILDKFKAISDVASNPDTRRSSDMNQVMDQLKQGLGGYTGAQLQGQREQGQRAMDSNLSTGMRQAALANARGGVRGAAAGAQAAGFINADQRQRQQLEQDLFVKNADEMQRRQEGYQNTLGGLENTENDRMNTSLGNYAGQLGAQRADELERQKYNQDSSVAEKQGYLNTLYGASNLGQAQETAKINDQSTKTMTQLAKKNYGGRGRGKSSGTASTGPDYAGFANAAAQLYK